MGRIILQDGLILFFRFFIICCLCYSGLLANQFTFEDIDSGQKQTIVKIVHADGVCGTGSLVQFEGRRCVLTAGHCVKKESHTSFSIQKKENGDVWYFKCTPENFLVWIDEMEKSNENYLMRLFRSVFGILVSDSNGLDVALLEMAYTVIGDQPTVLSESELNMVKNNLENITFAIPVLFSRVLSENQKGSFILEYDQRSDVYGNKQFVFSGSQCEFNGSYLQTPNCTAGGNSGSPLIIKSVQKEELKNLVGKTLGVVSCGKSYSKNFINGLSFLEVSFGVSGISYLFSPKIPKWIEDFLCIGLSQSNGVLARFFGKELTKSQYLIMGCFLGLFSFWGLRSYFSIPYWLPSKCDEFSTASFCCVVTKEVLRKNLEHKKSEQLC